MRKKIFEKWKKWVALATMFTGMAVVLPQAFSQTSKPLRKVTVAVGGVTVLNVSYPWLMMPLALDYWKDEGYDVNVIAAPGSLQAVQQLATGNVDFAETGANVVIQANVMNNIPIRAVMNNSVVNWGVIVPEDGPVKQMRDLKGKNIGIVSLASGGTALLQSFLRKNGLNPDIDVKLIATGAGAPALEALRSNRVQALMFWSAAITGFENSGAKFRIFRDPVWAQLPDFSLATSQRVIDQDPAMVAAIVRGAVKATLFAETNPDCVRKLQWAHFPDTKPTGAPELTLARWDDNVLRTQLDSMKSAYVLNGGRFWGSTTVESYERLQNFMQSVGLINKKLPPSTFVIQTPGFFEKVNDFDKNVVMKQATLCSSR